MKKLISVTVAICIAITSLFTGIYAMADDKVTSADVKEKIEQAATYVTSNETASYTLSNARNKIRKSNLKIPLFYSPFKIIIILVKYGGTTFIQE